MKEPASGSTELQDYLQSWRRFHVDAEYRRESLTTAAWRGYEKPEFVDMVRRFGVPWVLPGLRYRRRETQS